MLRRCAPRNDDGKACYGLCLFNFFTEHFQLQPFVFSFSQFLLRLRQRIRGLVKSLAVLPVEIGIVKNALLLCNFGLQFRDRLRKRFQRVLFVEIQPAP